jgi:hypothetical protein
VATINNPFVSGRSDAEAGKSWKQAPYPKNSRDWVRYMSGYQGGLDAKRKAERLAARAAAQQVAEAVEGAQ